MNPIIANLSRTLLLDLRRYRERGEWPEQGEEFDFLTFALQRCRDSNAQLTQDLWVLYELSCKHGGFFVEFGAGDGKLLSNTYLLEKRYGWRGILAEPNPIFEPALRQNRTAFISTRCIAGCSGETVIFNQTADPHLSTIDKYSARDQHAAARNNGLRVSVETLSLRDLLIEGGAPPNIDYMSIDTEGSEFEILSSFDFAEFRPTLISVEHNNTEQRADIDALLNTSGYRQKFSEFTDFDAWYVRADLLRFPMSGYTIA